MQFIKIATKEVSDKTGKPKRMLLNVNNIVSIEEVAWEMPTGMDTAPVMMEATTIIMAASAHHALEINTRDPYENIYAQIEAMAGKQVDDPACVCDKRPAWGQIDCPVHGLVAY